MSYLRRVAITVNDGPNLDAFSRMRVSEGSTVFDSAFQYDLQPLIFETTTANGGAVAHNANYVSAALTTAALANSEARIQSKAYHRYIPAKSQLIVMTQVVGAGVANVVKRVGYFDANDGIFLEQNGIVDVALTRRTSTGGAPDDSDRVVQADWNLDTLDGSGDAGNPSGLTLDLSKASILIIDLQWLGMGRVRVGFDIDGLIYYVHQFTHANILAVPYMKTANLPVRWEVKGNGVATLYATCSSVQSEGGADSLLGYQFAYDRASISAGSGVQTYAFSVRCKATFNAKTNRMLIKPISFNCLVSGTNPVLLEVYYGTTMGGVPSWSDMDATYSGLQVDTAGTPSGGIKVFSMGVGSGASAKGAGAKQFDMRYPLVLDAAGTGYIHLTVYVTGVGGAAACRPGIEWLEVR